VNDTRELVEVELPTAFGQFQAHALESETGFVHVVLVKGDVCGRSGVLTRVHSECLTGDALGSLRCDCGVQLRLAMRMIASVGTGILVYSTGHEGRGIGLLNKLRAYVEQDLGADTVDANLHLGLPVDARRYDEAAHALNSLGVSSIRLLTNSPDKVEAMRALGITVDEMVPLSTAPHARNLRYLHTKRRRLGHLEALGEALPEAGQMPPDVAALMGPVRARADRPYVVLKYAQTLDGRIATANGDAKWISSETERTASHALRAACDAVLVGVGTVIQDDPQLTVRMVPGASPVRVVLDSTLRTPRSAKLLDDGAPSVFLTTAGADPTARAAIEAAHAAVHVLPGCPDGVDLPAALAWLREVGVESLLVEGGAHVITSLLKRGLVDRLIVGTAPTIIGSGTDAVGDLRTATVAEGIRLENSVVCAAGTDIISAFDVVAPSGALAVTDERAAGA
jgi:GTP cyclohydrolase II